MTKIAQDIMTKNPTTITPETLLSEAVKILLEKRFNGLPVVNHEGRLMGILCQSDLVSQHKKISLPSYFFFMDSAIPMQSFDSFDKDFKRMAAVTVGELMTENPCSISPSTTLDEIAALMVDDKYYTLPVVDEGILVGVVGKEDILRLMVSQM